MLFGNSPRFDSGPRWPSPGPGQYGTSDRKPQAVPFQGGYGRKSYLEGELQGEFFVFRPREISVRPQAYLGQGDLMNKPSFNVVATSETRKRLLKTVNAFF
jgi:hypothetical protein